MNYHRPFHSFMCKMNTTVFILNLFTSIYILMLISVDRCVSVVWPVWARNHRNVCRTFCVSLCVWAMALFFSSRYFVFSDTHPSYNKVIYCYINFARSSDFENRLQAMTITYFLLNFVIPFTVIVSCYAVIILRLRINCTLANQSSRSFKIIAAIIIVFSLCFAPTQTMNLFYLVNQTTDYTNETLCYTLSILHYIATSLVCLSSCINPLLYVFMSADFKDVVHKSILKGLETAFLEE